jgi:hypothetical protein
MIVYAGHFLTKTKWEEGYARTSNKDIDVIKMNL